MSSCCEGNECVFPVSSARCPASGTEGIRVDRQTVKALLTTTALQRLGAGEYRFCPAAGCDIVYFDEEGQTFSTSHIRVGVWQKQPEGVRTICYCFAENESDIRAEIARDGRSRAVERVRAHIQADRCACEIRNPRGACCLGDLTASVKRLLADVPSNAEVKR
jgi:hypothetical protein